MDQHQRLKQLLLGDDLDALEHLRRYQQDKQQRTADVADVLASAIKQSNQSGPHLGQALQEPVADSIRNSIQRNPGMFADALFPVIGPAIRRSIAETLKAMVQNINRTMEHSVSAKGIGWRIEAARTGVSFPEVVLKHTLEYRVEQAFLIHPTTGLLVAHAHIDQSESEDSDAVSGMLTAIQDFVQDSFKTEGSLDSLDIGGQTLWVLRGPHAMLAVVIRGIPPSELRTRLNQQLELMHENYGPALEAFDGDPEPVNGIDLDLEDCLESKDREDREDQAEAEQQKSGQWRWWLALVIILIAAVCGYDRWREHQLSTLISELDNQPGLSVLDSHAGWLSYRVRLLRDPLAITPEKIATEQGIDEDQIEFDSRPYHSLAPSILEQRTRQQLQLPNAINSQIKGHTLILTGHTSQTEASRLQRLSQLPAGLQAIDQRQLQINTTQRSLTNLNWLHTLLNAPADVSLSMQQNTLMIAGSAPWHWHQSLAKALAAIPEVGRHDRSKLQVQEWQQLQHTVSALQAVDIYFQQDIELTLRSRKQLQVASALARQVAELGQVLDVTALVEVIGHSDGLASVRSNQNIRQLRSQAVREALIHQGVPAVLLQTSADPLYRPSSVVNPEFRRVSFVVQLEQPAPE